MCATLPSYVKALQLHLALVEKQGPVDMHAAELYGAAGAIEAQLKMYESIKLEAQHMFMQSGQC